MILRVSPSCGSSVESTYLGLIEGDIQLLFREGNLRAIHFDDVFFGHPLGRPDGSPCR